MCGARARARVCVCVCVCVDAGGCGGVGWGGVAERGLQKNSPKISRRALSPNLFELENRECAKLPFYPTRVRDRSTFVGTRILFMYLFDSLAFLTILSLCH